MLQVQEKNSHLSKWICTPKAQLHPVLRLYQICVQYTYQIHLGNTQQRLDFLSIKQKPCPCKNNRRAWHTLPGCSSKTIAASWTLIQLVLLGVSWPLKLTLSSMKGEWIPTRFNTGGVRVFFSVRSLVSGISVLHMYCSTRGARFIPLTELEKYCLYT